VLGGSAIAAVIAMSACDPATSTEKTTTSAAPVAAATTSAATTAPPTKDAATELACTDIKKDLEENATKVAKAEKIGPPAGHIAVSAQWTAGSTAVIAHSIGANSAVSAAADKVQKEMFAIGEEYNKSAKAKPSKQKLDAAVKELDAACAAA
jgi:hypothetical protein